MDRSTKQKISKESQTLNDIMDQLDLIDIYRTFHPRTMTFTFFSSAHGTFSRIDHILGLGKSSLGKLKKIEIISSIFSDHRVIRLDIHYRKDWCWSWNSSTLATSWEELTHWKRPWWWEGLGEGREEDDRGWDGWMASPTRWTWVWVNSGSWCWTGRPGMLRFMGSQKVGHDWATELNWTDCGGHFTIDTNIELLCCTSETNTMLCFNYTLIKYTYKA